MNKFISLLTILWLTFCQPALAQVGLFIRPNSSSLSSPVSGQTWFFNSSSNTISVWNGSSFLLTSAPKNNFTAVINPAVGNDNTQGYSPGSEWFNTGTEDLYVCVNAATAAAVWTPVNNLGAGSILLSQLAESGATNGQSVIWNGTSWVASNPQILLSAILQSGALVGQVPVWNGTNWVPNTMVGTVPTPSAQGQIPIATSGLSYVANTLTAGSGIGISNGSGTITITNTGSGGFGNNRPMPTSGNVSGDYIQNTDWVQTGPIVANNLRLYVQGNVTINNTFAAHTGPKGGAGGSATSTSNVAGSAGAGLGGGSNTPGYNGFVQSGGGGGGANTGGNGGTASTTDFPSPSGGQQYVFSTLPMPGSGGGGGTSNQANSLNGAPGGAGGDLVYIFCTGTLHITSTGNLNCAGTQGNSSTGFEGAGGGGSGGGDDLRAGTAITIDSGGQINVNGGNGGSGNANAAGGGGGAGGESMLTAPVITQNGTINVSGGNVGTSGLAGNIYAGSGGGNGLDVENTFVPVQRVGW